MGGSAGTAGRPNPDGCALLAPGPGAHALVTDTSELFGPEFTVELWVRFDDVPDDLQADRQQFLMAETVDNDTGFYVEWGFGELSCVIRESSVWYAAGFPIGPSSSGEFRHVACVRDEQGLSLWVDGLWMSTSPDAIVYVHDGSPLVIGAGTALGSVPNPESAFTGAVDEVRFDSSAQYSVVFEGMTVMADEFTPQPRATLTSTTLALWHFDECSGETADDESPNARTATLEGSAAWLVP
jgi:hypothetical protein